MTKACMKAAIGLVQLNVFRFKKSHIRETLTLFTDAEKSTDTKIYIYIFIYFFAVKVPWKCRESDMEVPQKWHLSDTKVPLNCNSHSNRPAPANFPTIHSRLVQNHAFIQSWGKKPTPLFFENCVITGQYQEFILQPEESTTPGSGCFATSQTTTRGLFQGDIKQSKYKGRPPGQDSKIHQ